MSWRSAWSKAALVTAILAGCASAHGAHLQFAAPPDDHDADVWIDGNYVGRVADVLEPGRQIELAVGVHRVEVRKAGRFPVQRTIRVTRETPAEVSVQVELLADPG